VLGSVGLSMVLPATERFGVWDHWLSWALYAPHSSRVELYVAPTVVDQLPAELRARIDVDPAAVWVRVPIAKWSLDNLGSPIYPQARFELGVARYLAARIEPEFAIRAELLGTANRLNGQRSRAELLGRPEIERAADWFWLNTRPRATPESIAHD